MTVPAHQMTPSQMVVLLDAAFRVADPLAYLESAGTTFRMIDRSEDARAIAFMGCLLAEGEIELLMSLRATWKMGWVRSPESIVG